MYKINISAHINTLPQAGACMFYALNLLMLHM